MCAESTFDQQNFFCHHLHLLYYFLTLTFGNKQVDDNDDGDETNDDDDANDDDDKKDVMTTTSISRI